MKPMQSSEIIKHPHTVLQLKILSLLPEQREQLQRLVMEVNTALFQLVRIRRQQTTYGWLEISLELIDNETILMDDHTSEQVLDCLSQIFLTKGWFSISCEPDDRGVILFKAKEG